MTIEETDPDFGEEDTGAAPEEATEAAVLVAFLKRWNADRERGAVRELVEYQAEFPGYESCVAREYSMLDSTSHCGSPHARVPRGGFWEPRSGHRYRGGREIGRGGMGVVLDVWDRHLRRNLAMKVLGASANSATPPVPQTGSRSVRRFFEEAWIAGRLSHPGIVPVHDIGIDESGRPFFTMARIQGESLQSLIERGVVEPDEWPRTRLLGVVLRVCEAVAYAHSEGVVHRDLKPANVMVGSFGETFVLDWGLARVVDARRDEARGWESIDPAPDRTLAGDVLGTPAYMAPEQARGERDTIGPRTDVYAVGAMIYHVVCGDAPYSGSSSQQVLEDVVSGPPPAMESRVADRCPPELVAICGKAMARDPEARYASMADLADDLRAFLELRVVAAYEVGPFAEARKWIRRNRVLTAMGAAAVLALAIGLAVALFERSVAEENARRSDADFEFAHTVVDDMVQRVAAKDLVDVPGTVMVRVRVLERALRFYRELLERRQSNAKVRLFVSRALCELADAQWELGRFGEAERHLIDGVHEARLVFESTRFTEATAVTLATALSRLASQLHERGKPEEANARFVDAVATLDRAIEEIGPNAAVLRHKAEAFSIRGSWMAESGDWRAAIEASRVMLEAARSAKAIDAHHADAHTIEATALLNIASACLSLGDRDAGRPAIQEAIALIESRPELWTSRQARYKLATAFDVLGTFTEDDDPESAKRCANRAISIARSLIRDYPEIAQYHYDLGRLLKNASFGLDGDEHAACCAESVLAYEKALALAPGRKLFAQKLAEARQRVCAALLRIGDHRGLAAQAARMEVSRVEERADDVAVLFIRCSLLAERDATLDDEARRSLMQDYAGRAVASLLRAADAGDLERLDREEFEVLEGLAEYRELQQRLGEGR